MSTNIPELRRKLEERFGKEVFIASDPFVCPNEEILSLIEEVIRSPKESEWVGTGDTLVLKDGQAILIYMVGRGIWITIDL